MEKREENKRTMYEAVLAVIDSSTTQTATIPAFAEAETRFRSKVAEIETKAQAFNEATSGRALNKKAVRKDLADTLFALTATLFAYARKKKDGELEVKSTIHSSTLAILRDTELITKANVIHALLVENLAQLAGYKITDAEVTDLGAKIATFQSSLGNRERGASERKGARGTLSDLFRQADQILQGEIDRFMERLGKDDAELLRTYRSARLIRDMGLRHKKSATPANASQSDANKAA